MCNSVAGLLSGAPLLTRFTALIGRDFFQRDTLLCARELIGTTVVWERCSGMVVETEAYLTENDQACHTFSRPSTREFVKRNTAGCAYIYFNYGMHWMLNMLIKGGPRDGLILIRALEPRSGIASDEKTSRYRGHSPALFRAGQADPGACHHGSASRAGFVCRSSVLLQSSRDGGCRCCRRRADRHQPICPSSLAFHFAGESVR